MSASLRDRRVRLYGYSNAGTGGFVSAKYTFVEERWASLVQTGGAKTIVATAPEEKSNAVFDFDPSVAVDTNDLLVDLDSGDRYFVRTTSVQRIPAAKLVTAEKISKEVFSKLIVVEPLDPNRLDHPTYDASVVES